MKDIQNLIKNGDRILIKRDNVEQINFILTSASDRNMSPHNQVINQRVF